MINTDAILNYEEYWDMTLATSDIDYDTNLITRTEIIKDGLGFWFDINDSRSYTGGTNLTSLKSLSAWTGSSVSKEVTLSDIGLTGRDNGRFTSLTGETLIITTADTKLELFQVTGYSSTTVYSVYSANTTNVGNYLSLSGGGYFQGFYKLKGFAEYDIFPNRTELGWTIENWLKFSGQSGTNSNFFFYIGTRAENKFNTIFSGESGYTTTSGISLQPPSSGNTDLDLDNTVLAFRFSGDTIGWRKVSGSTNCSGSTTGITIQEGYSKPGILNSFSSCTESDWINLTIRWKRYRMIGETDECTILSGTTPYLGDLTFYINARPVYTEKNFEEPIFKPLRIDQTLQQGVPFNISWGGGSFGLKESTTFDGPNMANSGLTIENNFDGNLNGGISQLRFYTKPLSVDKLIHNFNVERGRYGRNETWGGRIINIDTGTES